MDYFPAPKVQRKFWTPSARDILGIQHISQNFESVLTQVPAPPPPKNFACFPDNDFGPSPPQYSAYSTTSSEGVAVFNSSSPRGEPKNEEHPEK